MKSGDMSGCHLKQVAVCHTTNPLYTGRGITTRSRSVGLFFRGLNSRTNVVFLRRIRVRDGEGSTETEEVDGWVGIYNSPTRLLGEAIDRC